MRMAAALPKCRVVGVGAALGLPFHEVVALNPAVRFLRVAGLCRSLQLHWGAPDRLLTQPCRQATVYH